MFRVCKLNRKFLKAFESEKKFPKIEHNFQRVFQIYVSSVAKALLEKKVSWGVSISLFQPQRISLMRFFEVMALLLKQKYKTILKYKLTYI